MADATLHRVYVGGLGPEVSESLLSDRFRSFGEVLCTEIVPARGFAYVDMMTSDASLKRCQSLYNNTKWLGGTLKVGEARPSFAARLQKEWEENEALEKKRLKRIRQRAKREAARIHTLDFARMDDEEYCKKVNWAKVRFGRLLPVLDIKAPGRRYPLKLDPKKIIVNVKRFKDDELGDPEPTQPSSPRSSPGTSQSLARRCPTCASPQPPAPR
jgi:RNA recognition motif-containing protein